MSFATLARYYALLDQMMHLGAAATAALSTGQDPNGTLAKVAGHLQAATTLVDDGQMVLGLLPPAPSNPPGLSPLPVQVPPVGKWLGDGATPPDAAS